MAADADAADAAGQPPAGDAAWLGGVPPAGPEVETCALLVNYVTAGALASVTGAAGAPSARTVHVARGLATARLAAVVPAPGGTAAARAQWQAQRRLFMDAVAAVADMLPAVVPVAGAAPAGAAAAGAGGGGLREDKADAARRTRFERLAAAGAYPALHAEGAGATLEVLAQLVARVRALRARGAWSDVDWLSDSMIEAVILLQGQTGLTGTVNALFAAASRAFALGEKAAQGALLAQIAVLRAVEDVFVVVFSMPAGEAADAAPLPPAVRMWQRVRRDCDDLVLTATPPGGAISLLNAMWSAMAAATTSRDLDPTFWAEVLAATNWTAKIGNLQAMISLEALRAMAHDRPGVAAVRVSPAEPRLPAADYVRYLLPAANLGQLVRAMPGQCVLDALLPGMCQRDRVRCSFAHGKSKPLDAKMLDRNGVPAGALLQALTQLQQLHAKPLADVEAELKAEGRKAGAGAGGAAHDPRQ